MEQTILYDLNGSRYAITDREEIHKRIQEDAAFADEYFKGNLASAELQTPSTEASSCAGPNWKKEQTLLLLEEYRRRVDSFRDPKVKKKIYGRKFPELLLKKATISPKMFRTKNLEILKEHLPASKTTIKILAEIVYGGSITIFSLTFLPMTGP
ncbi:uncharacterized protein LOC124161884 [Ischnura elegans]|uniref:uncharacterized protein LOC124161884 n=1 Tax=Ischnura elegans TaxID=197161 RepID=UPI001ED86733|nr:uncharacterized protein LOC124161884 [Ischnura elegans]